MFSIYFVNWQESVAIHGSEQLSPKFIIWKISTTRDSQYNIGHKSAFFQLQSSAAVAENWPRSTKLL